MARTTYLIIITILFFILYIPEVLTIILKERILINYIDRNFIKLLLIFFIGFMESTWIKKEIPGIVGWLMTILMIFGLGIQIMHWPKGNEALIITSLGLLVLWTVYAYLERNKNILNYLLWCFMLLRISIYLTLPNEILWWADILLGTSISIIGTYYCYQKFRNWNYKK